MNVTTLDRETPAQCRLTIISPAGNCVLLYRTPTDQDLDVHQWRVALALGNRDEEDPARARAALQRARRETVITGWEDVCNEANEPIPFTQDRLLALMLRVPTIEQSVMSLLDRLYELESIVGEPQPPRKPGTPADVSTPGGETNSANSDNEPAEPASPSTSG